MRILVNARFLLKDKLEGIGLYSYEILRRLVANHPEDQFIFCFDRPYDDRFIFGDNVEPVVIRPPARHPFLFIWWFQVAIPRLYRQKQADAFFSPDGFLSLSPKVKKSLLVIHDLAFIHYPLQVSPVVLWYYRKFVPRFIEKADHIVTVSEASREDVEKNYPSAMGKISVIYNGVRDYFKPLPQAEQIKTRDLYSGGNPYFIAVGAIHPRKNIERLLNAYQVFRQQNESSTRLIIVGRKAWKTGTVESIYLKHPFKDDILFLGYVADDILANLVGSSAGLLFISLFEGFGLPIVEAMRSEVPVITSNRSSMREVAGAAALLVDPEDIEDIAMGMRSLDQDKDYCQTLIQRGKERASIFDWDVAANQMSERLHLLNW
jgi:glycosyltransferase involved in cell wall biosynthesis